MGHFSYARFSNLPFSPHPNTKATPIKFCVMVCGMQYKGGVHVGWNGECVVAINISGYLLDMTYIAASTNSHKLIFIGSTDKFSLLFILVKLMQIIYICSTVLS